MRNDELRIMFMRDLVDTCYVFCGVYRVDKKSSSREHIIWERVADECDLSHLDYLEQLRN